MLSGGIAIGLIPLRCIYTRQPHLVLYASAIKNFDRVAISD